jgi:hypothetical protein
LTRLDLLHAENNPAFCRVARKCGYVLRELLPPAPPAFPARGHRHVRTPYVPEDSEPADARPGG